MESNTRTSSFVRLARCVVLIGLAPVVLLVLAGCTLSSPSYVPSPSTYDLDPFPEFLTSREISVIGFGYGTPAYYESSGNIFTKRGRVDLGIFQGWTQAAVAIVQRELEKRGSRSDRWRR